MKKYKYKAFISYRHQPFDKAVAEKLHRLIETYPLPKDLAASGEKWVVFRDQDELPLSSNLGDDIKSALEQSEYLIVICSLRLQASEWCKEEIRYFKELHSGSTKNILAVLIDGTPDECFPAEILTSEDNGSMRNVEPLAGNIVAPTEKESFHLLRTEYLRLAAYFLDCGYDELYQRARRRKRKMYTIFGTTVFLVLALIASISIYSAITISNRNQALLVENSKHLTIQSENLWKNGKPIEAIETVLEALPSKDNDRPANVNAEYLLSEQIGAYQTDTFAPIRILEHRTNVDNIYYVGNGDKILTSDKSGIYFWNREDCTLIRKYTPEDFESENLALHVEETNYESASIDEGSSLITETAGAMELLYGDVEIQYGNQINPDIYMYDSKNIWKIDGTTTDILWHYSYSENDKADETTKVSFMNGYIIFKVSTKKEEYSYDLSQITFLNPADGTVSRSIDCTGWDLSSLDTIASITKNQLYLISFSGQFYICEMNQNRITSKNIYPGLTMKNQFQYAKQYGTKLLCVESYTEKPYQKVKVLCINLKTSAIEWETEIAQSLLAKSGFSGEGAIIFKEKADNYNDFFLYTIHNYSCLLDTESGEIVAKYSFEEDITNVHLSENGCVFLTTEGNTEYAFNANHISEPLQNTLPSCCRIKNFTTDLAHIARFENEYLTLGDASNLVYVYRKVTNADFTETISDPNQKCDVRVSPSGLYALVKDSQENAYYLYDIEKMEIVKKLSQITPDQAYLRCFLDNSKCAFSAGSNQTLIYDIIEDKVYGTIDGSFYSASNDGKWLIDTGISYNGYIISDADGNKYSWSLDKDAYTLHSHSLSGDGMHVFFACTIEESGASVIAYNKMTETNATVLEVLESSEAESISEILWLTDTAAAVIYDNQTVEVYDISKKKCIKSCDFSDSIYSETSSLHSIGSEDYIIIIGIDGKIYKLNLNNGEIEAELNMVLTSTEFLSSEYRYVYSTLIEEKNLLILQLHVGTGWTNAYFLDIEEFAFRCQISDYWGFSRECDQILAWHGAWGFYPYYTTEELITKAEAYLGK